MSTLRCTFTAALSITVYGSIAQFQPVWDQLKDYPYPVYGPYSFVVGDRVFTGGGITEGSPLTFATDFFEYQPVVDTWQPRAPLPGPTRFGARGFGLNGKGYVCLGWTDGAQLSDLWEYDPLTDSWEEKAPFPADPRYTAISVATSTKGYVGLGYTPYQNDWWEYDPVADAWTPLSPFPGIARQSSVSFVIDDVVYVGLGANEGNGESYNDLYRYEPSTDTWTQMADLPGPGRYTSYSFSVAGRGVVVCGLVQIGGTYTATNEAWSYDPVADAWELIGEFPGLPRGEGAYCWSSEYGYMGMGRWSFDAGSLSANITDEFWRMRMLITGTPEVSALTSPRVNWSDGQLFIEPRMTGQQPLTILDAAGRHVLRTTVRGDAITRLNVPVLSAGVHLVRVGTAPAQRIAIGPVGL